GFRCRRRAWAARHAGAGAGRGRGVAGRTGGGRRGPGRGPAAGQAGGGMTAGRGVVADDHEGGRTGVAALLGSQAGFTVVGTARDGAEAVRLCSALKPDVVLMDVRMPGMDGIEATGRLAGSGPRVLILTTFDLDEYVYDALRAGASGFLLKDVTAERLFE